MNKKLILVATVAVCALIALGCAPKVKRCAISGSVTSDGTPVPVGTVQFIPENPDPNLTITGGTADIVDGQYSIPAGPNALAPGKYLVRVVASAMYDRDGNVVDPMDVKDGLVDPFSVKSVDLVPPAYGSESEQYVEIGDEKTKTYDINMVSK